MTLTTFVNVVGLTKAVTPFIKLVTTLLKHHLPCSVYVKDYSRSYNGFQIRIDNLGCNNLLQLKPNTKLINLCSSCLDVRGFNIEISIYII